MATSIIMVAAGAGSTVSPPANTLGFVPLPPAYGGLLAAMSVSDVVLTLVVKNWFIRRFGE